MSKPRIPRPAPELIWRELEDGVVVITPQAGKVRVFNKTGTAIWRLLAESRSVSEIEAYLAEAHQVSREQVAADLRRFLDELTERGLLEWRPAT